MTKQTIFGRISQLTRANINALIDSAEDPERMLDQMVRDYTNNISEAEDAVAQTIGNLRLLEQDMAEDQAAVQEWGNKALAASRKADEFRQRGDMANADKFDNLAKIALERQLQYESEVKAAMPQIETQRQVVEKLKTGLQGMKQKLSELQAKRSELISRAKMAQAQTKVHEAVKSIDVMDPTSELGRFEEKIRREEAKVAGHAELAASSIDTQFESLEDMGEQAEIEARLAALKAGTSPAALGAATAGALGTGAGSGGGGGVGSDIGSGVGSGVGSSATAVGAPTPGTVGAAGQRPEADAEYATEGIGGDSASAASSSVPWTGGDAPGTARPAGEGSPRWEPDEPSGGNAATSSSGEQSAAGGQQSEAVSGTAPGQGTVRGAADQEDISAQTDGREASASGTGVDNL
jgi:phage shock protein A